MEPTDKSTAFWSRVARRYAAMPVRDAQAYRTTMDLVRQHVRPEQSVLELGCGTGSTAILLAPAVRRYVATDYAAGMIAIARERQDAAPCDSLAFCIGAIGDGSLPTGPFDAILAFNLLHLLPDRTAALAEIADMLPTGGLFISKTPCLGGDFRMLQPVIGVLRWLGKAPHVRFISVARLERDITAAGFEITQTGSYPKRPPSRFIVARKH